MSNRFQTDSLSAGAFAIGMIIGGLTGFALWMATETFVFLPAFLGVGVALGLALQSWRDGKGGQ